MLPTKMVSFSENALAAARRFFCVLTVFAVTACDKSGTPDWDQPGTASSSGPAASEPVSKPAPAKKPVEAAIPAAPPAAPAPASTTPTAEQPSTSGVRFIAYNVKNWLKMDRYVERKSLKDATKPQSEKDAVIAILARHAPDVVGLCEIGTAEDLAEIQQLLKAAGIDLPHSHYTGGSDPVRHLGILSRFPIGSTAKPDEVEYQINGKTFAINRGILDVVIDARGQKYRFVGVHLKSKRDVEEGDQEEMRRAEARLLRRHVDKILGQNPDERLIVYGDFNDTRASNSGKAVFGSYNDPNYLTAIMMKDAAGTMWTHFWALHDVYSRIDFITVNETMKGETDFDASRILDDPEWFEASDHRPALAVFR